MDTHEVLPSVAWYDDSSAVGGRETEVSTFEKGETSA
jgi:hypothetical protein